MISSLSALWSLGAFGCGRLVLAGGLGWGALRGGYLGAVGLVQPYRVVGVKDSVFRRMGVVFLVLWLDNSRAVW